MCPVTVLSVAFYKYLCYYDYQIYNIKYVYINKIISESCLIVSYSLQPHGLYSPWNSLGQNTGEGSLSLSQGIFPSQGLNPGLLHGRQILYQLS